MLLRGRCSKGAATAAVFGLAAFVAYDPAGVAGQPSSCAGFSSVVGNCQFGQYCGRNTGCVPITDGSYHCYPEPVWGRCPCNDHNDCPDNDNQYSGPGYCDNELERYHTNPHGQCRSCTECASSRTVIDNQCPQKCIPPPTAPPPTTPPTTRPPTGPPTTPPTTRPPTGRPVTVPPSPSTSAPTAAPTVVPTPRSSTMAPAERLITLPPSTSPPTAAPTLDPGPTPTAPDPPAPSIRPPAGTNPTRGASLEPSSTGSGGQGPTPPPSGGSGAGGDATENDLARGGGGHNGGDADTSPRDGGGGSTGQPDANADSDSGSTGSSDLVIVLAVGIPACIFAAAVLGCRCRRDEPTPPDATAVASPALQLRPGGALRSNPVYRSFKAGNQSAAGDNAPPPPVPLDSTNAMGGQGALTPIRLNPGYRGFADAMDEADPGASGSAATTAYDQLTPSGQRAARGSTGEYGLLRATPSTRAAAATTATYDQLKPGDQRAARGPAGMYGMLRADTTGARPTTTGGSYSRLSNGDVTITPNTEFVIAPLVPPAL